MTKKTKLTINDIARDLGVSKTTISRAISGKGRIGAETRAKVMEYIESHNYRPNAAAKSLADRRSYNLALVMPDSFDGASLQQTVHSVWEEAIRQDYNVLLFFSAEEGFAALVRTLDNRKADGVILAGKNEAIANLLKQRQIPFATPANCREFLLKLRCVHQSR